MKKLILLALIPLALAACQKAGTSPTKPIVIGKDTIPDSAALKIQLVKDSSNNVEFLVLFSRNFHLNYINSEDVEVPGRNPNFNISAISSDGILLTWDGVPYSPGMSIPIDVNATNGPYFLRTYYFHKIPSYIHVWCRDNYLKDSLDLRTGNYHFSIDNADTNSFGRKRFQIVVR